MRFHTFTILASILALSGCALSPGAQLSTSRSSSDYRLVDINETYIDHQVIEPTVYEALPANEPTHYEYRVGPHDILSIRVWNNPDLSTSSTNQQSAAIESQSDESGVIQRQSVTPEGVEVQANGRFFYPFAGTVVAAGRTVDDIRKELTHKLSDFVVEPQVSVRVQEFNSQKVQILGEVNAPQPISITSNPLHVLDAIALAEGLTSAADRAEAVLIRQGKRTVINMSKLLNGDLSQNYLLLDGDVLNIDNNRYRQIVILGEVNKPVAMPYDHRGMSLNDALVEASGISQHYANASGVYVLRNRSEQMPTIFRLDISNATSLLIADRFPLEPRDVVYVDTAGVTRWNRVINQLLPTTNAINTFTQ